MYQSTHHRMSASIIVMNHGSIVATSDAETAMNGAVSFGVSSVAFANNGWWRSWHSKSLAHHAIV